MGIIHRDVTPSNVYLSGDGRVKLGDFGIARSSSRATIRTTGSAALKGKFAYLSPEQVAGETFDQRADLFSTAVVLSEMLLGHPLFAGSGQLAVLLAIRDCRIDSLREASASLPKGLFPVLERALARDPSKRFQTAAALSEALAPFAADAGTARGELGALVRWVQTAPSVEQINAVREGAAQLRSSLASRPETESTSERTTGEYTSIPSFVVTAGGERIGPWAFARLVEAIATGQVGRGDMVDYMGRGLAMLESIESLARFLPSLTAATTNRLGGVTSPEFVDAVSVPSLVAVLLRAVESEATGVLFAEGPTESRALPKVSAGGQSERGRKELYIVNGKLHHVASNNASELLGEYLVRRSVISREELDFALAVLPRYGGRMGDTLISLGLVSSLDIFRAIRDQGKDRLVDLFRWQSGELSFYAGQTAKHVEFPLDLEIPPLILAGLEAAKGEVQLEAWRPRLDHLIGPPDGAPPKLHAAAWPPLVRRLLVLVDHPKPLREVLAAMAQGGAVTASEALRAVDVLLIAKLLVWR
jgi:serine/threonine-protein kinase